MVSVSDPDAAEINDELEVTIRSLWYANPIHNF